MYIPAMIAPSHKDQYLLYFLLRGLIVDKHTTLSLAIRRNFGHEDVSRRVLFLRQVPVINQEIAGKRLGRDELVMDLKRKQSKAPDRDAEGAREMKRKQSKAPDRDAEGAGEMISSTKSLVTSLNLTGDINIQPVHSSLCSVLGKQDNFWFSITAQDVTNYFSCENAAERDVWIANLRQTLTPGPDVRRTTNSLKLWVFEVKGLSEKKKYFCEILLDGKIVGRTSIKTMSQMCFWGEGFNFTDLPKVEKINILIFEERSWGTKKTFAKVDIPITNISTGKEVETWYQMTKIESKRQSRRGKETAKLSIRVKSQFQSIDILPMRDYAALLKFLTVDYMAVCRLLEPKIPVKVKEEVAHLLMTIFNIEGFADDVLAEIVVNEICSNEDESLTFRGNSIATKSVEAFLKMVGQNYLSETLGSTIEEILQKEPDFEIDPFKIKEPELLSKNQANLLNYVNTVWQKIEDSFSYFPIKLQRCFYKIRQELIEEKKTHMVEKLISSCLFLRYLCPAILGPNLFNLTNEYPNPKSNRNLTLLTKTLMTLANFTRYEGKENQMEFMNKFLDSKADSMMKFLHKVTSQPGANLPVDMFQNKDELELGKTLSRLHAILMENMTVDPSPEETSLEILNALLSDINETMHVDHNRKSEDFKKKDPLKDIAYGSTLLRKPLVRKRPEEPSIVVTNENDLPVKQELEIYDIISRLIREEDDLRRDQKSFTSSKDKEIMILLQQRKVSAIDDANKKLLKQLEKFEKVKVVPKRKSSTASVTELVTFFDDPQNKIDAIISQKTQDLIKNIAVVQNLIENTTNSLKEKTDKKISSCTDLSKIAEENETV